MFVGVMRLHLAIAGARTLKDKRRVVLSFKERAQARLRISVAEVGALDHPRHATIGAAVVANEARHCEEVLESLVAMASTLSDALLTDRSHEILPFGEGGTGVRGGLADRFDADADPVDDEDDAR